MKNILVFALGMCVAAFLLAIIMPSPVERVVCESGDEVQGEMTENNPYLVWHSVCHINDVNGRSITVEMID